MINEQMIKHVNRCILFFMVILGTSCVRNQRNQAKDNAKIQTKDLITAYGPSAMVRNVKKGKNGTILIAASFSGVFRYNGKSFTNLTSKIGSRRFWDVLEDRNGNLWFATTDSGVYYIQKSKASGQAGFQHFTTKEGLASNSVMSIYEDKAGMIWFGTGGGVSRYTGKQHVPGQTDFQNFTTKDGLSNNGIHTIIEDRTGKLWFGTNGEACFYDKQKFTVLKNKDGKPFNNVWGITEDKKGNIWFGATIIEARKGDTLIVTAGLWCYNGTAFTKINQRGTSAIIEDKKGNLWTTGSLNPNGVGAWTLTRYDQKFLNNEKPATTDIMSTRKMLCGILEAEDGNIWFGSLNGVYRYDGKTITDFRSNKDVL